MSENNAAANPGAVHAVVWISPGQALDRPCAPIPTAALAGRVLRTCGGVKGSGISLCRFLQDLVVQGEVGNSPPEPDARLLKPLEA